MKIGSKSGRLAKSLKKSISSFRWMGCKFAVYEFINPSESGMKVRKDPVLRRGSKRRGRRSTRGGRKRRALAGAAPEIHETSVTKVRTGVGSGVRRARRKVAYSAALISAFCRLSAIREKVRRTLKATPEWHFVDVDVYTNRVNNLQRSMRKTRRSWLELAKTSGDAPAFNDLKFRMLVSGKKGLIDWSGGPTLRSGKLDHDWYGELILERPKPLSKAEERPADHVYECAKCARVTNLRVCRLCGSELAPPKGNRSRVAKASSKFVKRRGTSGSYLTERKE
jgi:hypothetical protein